MAKRTYYELQAAIWTDERGMPPTTRELALAIAFVMHREPEHEGRLWQRVKALTGTYEHVPGWRYHELVARDAPRYKPPRGLYGVAGCEGPRLRPYRPRRPAYLDRCNVSDYHPHIGECRYPKVYGDLQDFMPDPERDDRACGAHATISVPERDMVTGWVTEHWFCTRHKERAREVRAQIEAKGEPPEPIPNTGGLLPRYFDGDWPKIYSGHCEKWFSPWSVPYHGVNADDWPVPGRTLIPRRPRLSVVSA